MNPIDVTAIRETLQQLRKAGHTAVSIDALDKFLASMPADKDHLLAIVDAAAAGARTQYESAQREHLEFNRFAIESGRFALQVAMLVNGGAAIAMLGFIGSAWKATRFAAAIPLLASSEYWFAWGVLLAAFASGLAYLTQWCFLHKRDKAAYGLTAVSALVTIGSYGVFLLGIVNAHAAFVSGP